MIRGLSFLIHWVQASSARRTRLARPARSALSLGVRIQSPRVFLAIFFVVSYFCLLPLILCCGYVSSCGMKEFAVNYFIHSSSGMRLLIGAFNFRESYINLYVTGWQLWLGYDTQRLQNVDFPCSFQRFYYVILITLVW